jgi:hypothetical protein
VEYPAIPPSEYARLLERLRGVEYANGWSDQRIDDKSDDEAAIVIREVRPEKELAIASRTRRRCEAHMAERIR